MVHNAGLSKDLLYRTSQPVPWCPPSELPNSRRTKPSPGFGTPTLLLTDPPAKQPHSKAALDPPVQRRAPQLQLNPHFFQVGSKTPAAGEALGDEILVGVPATPSLSSRGAPLRRSSGFHSARRLVSPCFAVDKYY
jgi:hypothetical protein